MEESKKTKKKKKSRRLFSDEAEAAVVKREKRIQNAVDKARNNPNTGERREVPIEAIPRRRRRSSRDQSTHSQSYSLDAESHLPPAAQISNNDAPTSNAEQYKEEKKKEKSKSKTERLFRDEAEAAQVKKDERIRRAIQKEEKRQLQRSIKEEERRRRAEEEMIQNNGGSQNDEGKPTKSRRTFGGEIEHTKAKRERRLQKAVEKGKKKIVKRVEKIQGAEAAEAIVFRDDYEKAIEEEQRKETEQKSDTGKQSDVGNDIEKFSCAADASNDMEEPEASASARIDLSSASLNTRRSVATRRLFEPFPSATRARERRKIKPCALVDCINVACKKTAVLVHPRLMVNGLSTEQAADPRDYARRQGSNRSMGTFCE